MARTSQEERILNELSAAWPSWTPAPTLSRIALAYGRAVFNLRQQGWKISNRVTIVDGIRHGEFRLGDPPIGRSSELRVNRQPATPPAGFNRPVATSGQLFDLHRRPD